MRFDHTPARQGQSGIANDADRLLVPIPDACNLLGIKRTKIYGLLAAGDLTGVHLGKRHLVTMASIRALADRLVAEAA